MAHPYCRRVATRCFCRRLRTDHHCDIKVGLPTVRYEERLKAPLLGIEHETKSFGAEIRLKLNIRNQIEVGEGPFLQTPDTLEPFSVEILQSVLKNATTKGSCGYGPWAGLSVDISEIFCSVTPAPPPLLSKSFQDALQIHVQCAEIEVFEPIMRLEIIIPDAYCGAVLEDLATRGGIIRKLDSDGVNSIILLEIPLANTFGYTTLLRSLSKGLGVFVLTYEKHGPRKRA